MANMRKLCHKSAYVPNREADMRRRNKAFFHNKDVVESEERIDRIREKMYRKMKEGKC